MRSFWDLNLAHLAALGSYLAAQGSHLVAYAIYAVFAAYCCPGPGYRNPEPMPRGGSNVDPWPQQTKDLLLGLRPRLLDIDLRP